jgi:myosin heavy subunit
MTLVGIPLDDQASIFAAVASVLHLGNIRFVEGPEESSQLAGGDAQFHLDAAAQLLGVSAQGLAKALTTRTRVTHDGDPLPPSSPSKCSCPLYQLGVEGLNKAISICPPCQALR